MYKASVRRAYFGISPHLWPFYLWGKIIKWSLLAVVGGLAFVYVAGGAPFDVRGFVIFAYSVGVGAFLFGLIPATVLTLLDILLVRRPAHRPAKFDSRAPRFDRQRRRPWTGLGAAVGAGFGVVYSVVYLNAYAPESSLSSLVISVGPRLAVGGAAAGWLVATGLNRAQGVAPATTLAQQQGRGGVLWAAIVTGLGAFSYFFVDPTLERTLLPAALMAIAGALLLPPLATTPPIDLAAAPPPATESSAPSPRQSGPEGGEGEGATQDQSAARAASTSSIDSIEERMING